MSKTLPSSLAGLPTVLAAALAPLAPITGAERQAIRDKLRDEYDQGLDGLEEDERRSGDWLDDEEQQ